MVNDYLKEVIDMETLNTIDFIGRLYERAKSDLYVLLVNNSSNKLEYKGRVEYIGDRAMGGHVTISYLLVNPTSMDYTNLLSACCSTLNNLLKQDIRMWGKAELLDDFYGVAPKFESACHFELSLKFKEESK